jgi:hypothetical protein
MVIKPAWKRETRSQQIFVHLVHDEQVFAVCTSFAIALHGFGTDPPLGVSMASATLAVRVD